MRRVAYVTRHRFGCVCGLCTRRAADTAAEARRVKAHNHAAMYTTGPRVTLPPASRAENMHYRCDWMCAPKPGELEYLTEPGSHHTRGTVPNFDGRW